MFRRHTTVSLISLLLILGCSRQPELSPEARFNMSIQAQAAVQEGQYETAARLYSHLYILAGKRTHYAVEAAAAYSRAGETGKAVQFLHRALKAGWRDLSTLETRADFTPLRSTLEWNGLVSDLKVNQRLYLSRVNPDLYVLFQSDQADRQVDTDTLSQAQIQAWVQRDRQRMMATDSILAVDSIRFTSDDFFHAALIFQHGPDSTWYKRANTLCKRALELNPDNEDAKWLYAASLDRYLHSVGRPQIYGTRRYFKDGIWTAEPFDTSAVSDSDRIEHDVPPASFSLARIQDLNQKAQRGE